MFLAEDIMTSPTITVGKDKKVKEALEEEKIWDDPVVTEIVPLDTFYEAEEEHHDYFEKNPDRAYCQMVILPKVEKFKSMFNDLLDTDR